ncbi:Uncharacterised protein [Mycobacteroides abscessus subsp. abscessus]|nr:Uncharacterised protein [Mycobacteroides abscessus subsp. abscessus]
MTASAPTSSTAPVRVAGENTPLVVNTMLVPM